MIINIEEHKFEIKYSNYYDELMIRRHRDNMIFMYVSYVQNQMKGSYVLNKSKLCDEIYIYGNLYLKALERYEKLKALI